MAGSQCVRVILLAAALPACIQAMVLLSPPDKKSVERDIQRLRTKGEGNFNIHQLPVLEELEDFQPVMFDKDDDKEEAWTQTKSHAPNSDPLLAGTLASGHYLRDYAVIDEQDYMPIDDSDSVLERALEALDNSEDDERPAVGGDEEDSLQRGRDFSLKQAQRQSGIVNAQHPNDVAASLDDETKPLFRRLRRSTRRADPSRTRTRAKGQQRGRRAKGRMGRKRRRVVRAEVELLVVVENSIFRKFMANNLNNQEAALARLRQYYGIVVAMMDQRFQTIPRRRLRISVSISGIFIAETREDSAWLEKLVDWNSKTNEGRTSVSADKALSDFSKWVKANYKSLPKFDHAMVFTGYTLTSKYFGFPYGKAYLGAVCEAESGGAVSIVADSSDFQCVKVATHELAHSLGSVHDGDPGFENCPYDSNYIMSRVSTVDYDKLKNSFYFSSCSIKQMYKHLRSKSAECVYDQPKVFYKFDLHRLPPGKMFTPDQHCQMIYGPKATFCADVKTNICGQLWCRESMEKDQACRTNSYITALPGTPCGNDQTCHLGECMNTTTVKKRVLKTQRRHKASPHQHHKRQRPPHPTRASSPSSVPITSLSSRRQPPSRVDLVPGSSQSKLRGMQRNVDNAIPTLPSTQIRGRVGLGPGGSRRRARRLQQKQRARLERAQRKTQQQNQRQQQRHHQRQHSGRSSRRFKAKRKGHCKANQPDKNVKYCRRIVQRNPAVCVKRPDIYTYCCRTCAFRR